ncbi:MAG: preprotein translocase subunit SecE [Hyphomonadaceae bacterium]
MSEKKNKTGPLTYMRQVRAEGNKVTWTSRQETIASTIMVIIFSVLIALFLFFADLIINSVIKMITGL